MQLAAQPYAFPFTPHHCALLVIDMQRDFLEPGGFGAALGNDVAQLRRAIAPTAHCSPPGAQGGLAVIHTREGHRPDLRTCRPPSSPAAASARIGDAGPMGRILVRGEPGHAIIPELRPQPGEPVIDKPGKGAFFATDLHAILAAAASPSWWSPASPPRSASAPRCARPTTAATTAWCWRTARRPTIPAFHHAALAMICAQGGIFGWVGHSATVIAALQSATLEREPS